MHKYTLAEVTQMVVRMMAEGYPSLRDAVNAAAHSYGFTTDAIYIYMAKHNIGE